MCTCSYVSNVHMLCMSFYFLREGFPEERIKAVLHQIERGIKHQSSHFGLSLITVSILVCVCVCVCVHAHACVCMRACMCVRACTRGWVCVCMCMCVF